MSLNRLSFVCALFGVFVLGFTWGRVISVRQSGQSCQSEQVPASPIPQRAPDIVGKGAISLMVKRPGPVTCALDMKTKTLALFEDNR